MNIKSVLFAASFVLLGSIFCSPVEAFHHHGNSTYVPPVIPPTQTFPCVGTGSYASITNGYQACTLNKLVFMVFGQQPESTSTASGTDAAAAVAINAPIFFGQQQNWPTGAPGGSAPITALKNAVAYWMPNCGDTSANSASNTTANVDCNSALNNRGTVSNMLATAAASSYTGIIGWDMGDEAPGSASGCGNNAYNGTAFAQPGQAAIPTATTTMHSYDGTRAVQDGQGGWVGEFPYAATYPCGSSVTDQGALLAPDWVSFDYYPGVGPFEDASVLNATKTHLTDGVSTPYDAAWATGRAVAQVVAWEASNSVTKPIIATIADGGDALASDGAGFMHINTTINSPTITVNANSAFSVFSQNMDLTPPGGTALGIVNDTAWGGTCTAIQAGTVFSAVGAGTPTTATMSKNATATVTDCLVDLTGGTAPHTAAWTSCNSSNGLCAANGRAYRDSAVAVNGQMWGAIINGAQGIQFFCYDSTSSAFCLGATAGGSAATAVAANLTYITGVMNTYAPILNHTDSGKCSMQTLGNSINTSCSNGSVAMSTGTTGCIGQALLQYYPTDGHYYLFTMTDRDSSSITNSGCPTTGATFTWTLTGVPGGTATIVYDSNSHYDVPNDTTGGTKTITAGAFTDTLGDHSDGYRVKIYKI